MSRTLYLSAALSLCGMAVGCRSPLSERPYDDWVKQDPASWSVGESATLHHADTLRATPGTGRSPRGADPSRETPVDVQGWVALALRTNPGLRGASLRVERLRSRARQVDSLDDPMLQVSPIGEMAQTAAGPVEWFASVSQKLPLPGKLDARQQMVLHDAAAAEQELAGLRLQVAADVRRAFWGYLYTHRAVAVVERDRALLVQFRDIAQVKYRAGTVEQQDVLRAEVELAGLDNELLTLGQRQASAAGMLNRLTDRPTDAAIPAPDTVPLETLDLDLEALLAAAADHPRLSAIREEVARYRQQRRLARLDRYPDLTLSGGYSEVGDEGLSAVANGDDQWFVGFGISLPLWQGKRDAAEREALVGVMEATARLAEEQNQLAFRVHDALARVEAQRGSVDLFESRMLPEARQAVEAAEGSYRAGRTDFLTLIDNARRLTELELMHQRATTQLQQDLADLRLAAGLPDPIGDDDEQ